MTHAPHMRVAIADRLRGLGDYAAAAKAYADALRQLGSAGSELRVPFLECARHSDWVRRDPIVAELLTEALEGAWQRPRLIAEPAIRLLMADQWLVDALVWSVDHAHERVSLLDLLPLDRLRSLGSDPLLAALLSSTPVNQVAMERLLTHLRFAMLDSAVRGDGLASQLLPLHQSIALQCFENDFVFEVLEIDQRLAAQAKARLEDALARGRPVQAELVLAVATYFPLDAVGGCERLEAAAPREVATVVRLHILNPRKEREIAASIPRLGASGRPDSVHVTRQYQAAPYPRWSHAVIGHPARHLAEYLQQSFRNYRPRARHRGPTDVLVAGCGTGQEAIEVASSVGQSRMLAVDLSLPSLAFAQRRTTELGLESLSYVHGDLLDVDDLGRAFDAIFCFGVLHHLKQPKQGFQALRRVLAEDGVLVGAVYSAIGRRCVEAARQALGNPDCDAADAELVRKARQRLLELPQASPARGITKFHDFFSANECRDLLFPACEVVFDLPGLGRVLREAGLQLIELRAPADTLEGYRTLNPGDIGCVDLSAWHEYELAHPDAFEEMYVFMAAPG